MERNRTNIIEANLNQDILRQIIDSLKPKIRIEIEALLAVPDNEKWSLQEYSNKLDRIFDTMQETSLRAAQIVNLILNSDSIQTFQKSAEPKAGDVEGQQKERGTYTNADILAQLCFEISVTELNQILGEELQVALDSEEEVGNLTKNLKPTGQFGEFKVDVDPVDGTVYLTSETINQSSESFKSNEKTLAGNIRWYSTAWCGTDANGKVFGQANIPDKNLTFSRRPGGKTEVVQYLGTASERPIQPKNDQPSTMACINSRVPQSIQRIIRPNQPQTIETEKDKVNGKIGWRANGSALAFENGEYGICAITGKEMRDKVILELLAQDTERFTSFRFYLPNENGVLVETLVVINKQIEGYERLIQQFNKSNPTQEIILQARQQNM
jgi:hypothetical protein